MVSSLLNGRWRSWFFGRKLRRSLGSAGLVDVQSDSFFPMGGSACNEIERATLEQIRERPDCRRFGQGRRYRAASIQRRRPKTRPSDVAHGVGSGKKAWITGEVSPTPGPATRLRGPVADIAAFRERVPLALRLPACWLPPQAEGLPAHDEDESRPARAVVIRGSAYRHPIGRARTSSVTRHRSACGRSCAATQDQRAVVLDYYTLRCILLGHIYDWKGRTP